MKQANNADFSATLRYLIESAGLSIYKISAAIRISHNSLSNYCNGISIPSMDALIKLADYFAVPLDYLVGRCSAEEARAIEDNYPAHFMELRRAPYESYLIGRDAQIGQDNIGESPWPYNLMDEVFGEAWSEPLEDDQIAGIKAAIGELTDREQESVLLYYRNGLSLGKLGSLHGVTRERERQIIAKAVRKLRAPHRRSLMMYGAKGVEERSRLRQYRQELDKEAALLAEYEKQLTEKKIQLFDISVNTQKAQTYSLNMELSEMDLSVRSYNCLHRYGCRTLNDVIDVVEKGNLFTVRNLGRKSSEEILEKIYSLTGKRYSLIGEELTLL